VAHEFHVDKAASRLDIKTSGILSPEEADELIEGASRLCRKHALKGVLVDLNYSIANLDDLGLFRIGKAWAGSARGRIRTAFVKGNYPDLDRYFGEIVREHGVAWALFETRDEAELWLDREMTPAGPIDGA